MSVGLYIHIPFCQNKCPYCNFYSIIPNNQDMDSYTSAVLAQLKKFSKTITSPVDTIYFGGGTPSLMPAENLSSIMDQINASFHLHSPEVTLEVNPTKGKDLDFAALKSIGFNRLSIGLQSANDSELRLLGRAHSANDAKRTIRSAQSAGFDNISLDLMIALPGQTNSLIDNSIKFCSSMGICHVSSYMLKIEPGTAFYNLKDTLNLKNEDEAVDLYMHACEALEAHGFAQYEISNFSRPGCESRHNLKYWNCDEYLGIGPSAHSFIGGKRFHFENSFVSFVNGAGTISDGNGGDEEEYIMLRLRLNEGLKNDAFKRRFSKPIDNRYYKNAQKYISAGLVIEENGDLRLTQSGFIISNTIISDILL